MRRSSFDLGFVLSSLALSLSQKRNGWMERLPAIKQQMVFSGERAEMEGSTFLDTYLPSAFMRWSEMMDLGRQRECKKRG